MTKKQTKKHCDKCSHQTTEGLAVSGCDFCGCHEMKSTVNIKKSGKGYFIEINDVGIDNSLAITKSELEQIVVKGEKILKK